MVGLLLLLAVFASSVSAAQTHPYTGVSFGPDGVGGSASFERVQSVAVDPGNGDVYVYDGGAGKVYKFDSAGAPVSFSATGTNAISGVGGSAGGAEFEIAVAPAGSPAGTAGNIYVANNGSAIHVYSAAGTEIAVLDQGGETCGAATDPSGNFYAGIYGSTINKYTPTANPPIEGDKSDTGTAEGVGLCNVAADGLGNVYAANYGGNGLYKLEGLSDTTPALVDSGANTMGIAPGSNDLYANRGNDVVQYDSSGNLIGSFGGSEISESRGVAINSGATKVYVGNGSKVKVFGASTLVPDATTEAADGITKTTADLHGAVGAAGGPDATCVFQYVSQGAFFEHGFEGADEAPCSPAGPFTGTSTTAVSATATGLSAETTYRFRLLATSSNGSNGGSALSFTTAGAVNVETKPASGITDSSATLDGTVDPEGVELEECTFEYRAGFGDFEKAPCAESPAEIGSGSGPVSVHVDLTELSGGTDYQFRLVGRNELGTNFGTLEEFKTKGPRIIKESIAAVSETGATFKATINPNGSATSFVFEYVSQTDFEQSGFANAVSAPAGGESIGAGTDDVEVSVSADDLAPGTTYRVRAVATSADGVAKGSGFGFRTRAPAETFGPCSNDDLRGGFGASLPDCRAYEQATPTDKNGGSAAGVAGLIQAPDDGSAISYYSQAGFPGSVGAQDFGTFVATRGSSSWSTRGLLPPQALGRYGGAIGLTADGGASIAQVSEENQVALVYRDLETNETKIIVPFRPMCSFERGGTCFAYAGSSVDGTRVFFESFLPVTEPPAVPPATEPDEQNLYMWDAATEETVLVGVDAAGDPLPEGSIGGPYAWREIENNTNLGGALGSYYTAAIHAISNDGDKAVFTEGGTGQLFARVGLDGPTPTTLHVSKPQNDDEVLELPAAFLEATPDGRFIFFKSYGKLTPDAGTGESEGSWNLYRYEVATEELLDLTPGSLDEEGGADLGPEVQGLVGASSDGQVAYFVARGELVPGATAGEEHLYRFDASRTPPLALVATLKTGGYDERVWDPHFGRSADFSKNGRVSANGDAVVFGSDRRLTGYDNQGEHCFTGSGRCVEFYRWSTATETPECVTCDTSGVPPSGSASLSSALFNAVFPPVLNLAPSLPRNLSADGKRFFFQTPDSLSPRDTNGNQGCTYEGETATCMDVYEWEAAGTGSCDAAVVAGGCVYLLSSGKSDEPSYFGDADREGNNVFIFTSSRLVTADRDSLYDAYDVAVDGGLASQWKVAGSPCASAESCGGQRTEPAEAPAAGSESFVGPGNPKNKPKKKCHKGAKKCKKKHHKKKHHKRKQQGSRSANARTENLGEEK